LESAGKTRAAEAGLEAVGSSNFEVAQDRQLVLAGSSFSSFFQKNISLFQKNLLAKKFPQVQKICGQPSHGVFSTPTGWSKSLPVSVLLSKGQKSLACPRFKSSMRKLFFRAASKRPFSFQKWIRQAKKPTKVSLICKKRSQVPPGVVTKKGTFEPNFGLAPERRISMLSADASSAVAPPEPPHSVRSQSRDTQSGSPCHRLLGMPKLRRFLV
jgi:hypothetical protein